MHRLPKHLQNNIARSALAAKTVADADRLEAMIQSAIGDHRRPVGDIPDNLGAINAASDARLSSNERNTNGIDAILDLLVRQKYGSDIAAAARDLPNPRTAAHHLLGVPLAGPGAMTNAKRQALAERVQMTLVESGVPDRPTILSVDNGIGQTPKALTRTILAIYRGNKRDKPFLMGVYGWGGSNSFGFAKRTIVVSRRHTAFLDGEEDGVGVTIVRQVYEPSMRTPAYFYQVDSSDEILSLDPAIFTSLGLHHGTHIAHIEYDLGIKGALINQYNFFSAALFDPVMPIFLGSFREADAHPGRRTIIGAGGRLKSLSTDEEARAEGTKVAYTAEATIDLGATEGRVNVTVWVLDRAGAKPNAEITSGFVSSDSAITVTLNGQRQETERREWIKRVCKFPHLFRRMVVQIDADDLSQEAKVETFATTRERLRGRMRDRIFSELADLLAGDLELQRLESNLREEALKHTAERASDKDLDKLRKAIGKLGGRTREVEVEVEVEADGPTRRGGRGTPRDTDDSHLPDVPTVLTFDRHILTIEPGGNKKRVMVSIDAKNGYLPDHEDDLTISVEGPEGATRAVYPTTRTALAGGLAQWLIGATDVAAMGDYKLTASLKVGDLELTDSLVMTVVEARDKSQGGAARGGKLKQRIKQKKEVPIGPQVNWVRRDGWDEYGYGISTVGHVDEGSKGVDIYLNLDFDKLQQVLQNPRYTTAVVAARKSSYMVPTALGLYRIHQLDNDQHLEDETVTRMQQIVADSILLATDPEGILGVNNDDANE